MREKEALESGRDIRHDEAGNNWPVTMIAWDNGTYTLKDWYNVEGLRPGVLRTTMTLPSASSITRAVPA